MAALLSSFEILTTGNMTTESNQLDDIAIVHNRQQNVKDILMHVQKMRNTAKSIKVEVF